MRSERPSASTWKACANTASRSRNLAAPPPSWKSPQPPLHRQPRTTERHSHVGEPFADKMARLTAKWREQQAEAARLDAAIEENLQMLGFGVEPGDE